VSDLVTVTAVLARFAQVGGGGLVMGIFAFLVLVMRPASRAAGAACRDGFEALDRRLLRLAGTTLAVAMGAGLIDLVRQAFVATGSGTGGTLTPRTIAILLTETRYGDFWLVRQAFWLLLGALLVLREPERDRKDWLALRLAGLVLAGAGLAVGAASGHSASAPQSVIMAIVVDALHMLAAGVWAGALVPLVLFLRWARASGTGAPSPIVVAVAVRRFSALAALSIVVMLASGAYAIPLQVGSVPALLGTAYGHWLLIKLGLLLPLLVVAFVNRSYYRPRLERAAERATDAPDVTRVVAGLGRGALIEAAFMVAVFAMVAVLGLTTPARHDPVDWPLPFRLAWDATGDLPGVWTRVSIGGQLVILGVLGVLGAFVRRSWSRPALIGGAALVVLGFATGLPPLAVDAYPTTYVRPTVPYTVLSIVRGQTMYREQCASCHGLWGDGHGPAADGLVPRPPALTSRRIDDHTAGDLFWWLTHGIQGAMPGFGDRLSSEARWDLVNFVRALSAAAQAQRLTPIVTPRPAIVAPDLAFTIGVGAERVLREHRGRTIILLVFFRLPESLERLAVLAQAHAALRELGCEILAVPTDEAASVYRVLGDRPVLFTFVIGGARDATAAYGLFARDSRRPDAPPPAHMEFLIDRAGYLRARWLGEGSPEAPDGWNDVALLLREVERLAHEPASVAVDPGEHVH
jgi:putative copper resistance protein D